MTPFRLKIGYALIMSTLLVLLVYDLHQSRKSQSDELMNFLQNTTYFLSQFIKDQTIDSHAELQSMLENVDLRPGMSIGVMDSSAALIARHPYLSPRTVRDFRDPPAYDFVFGMEETTSFETLSPLDGLQKMVHMRRVPDKGLVVFVAESLDRHFGPWKTRLYVYSILYLIIAIGGYWLVRYQIRLNQSENKIRWIIDNISDIPIQGYLQDGTILYWNKASEKLYGYSAAEAVGRNAYDLIVPEESLDEIREQAADITNKESASTEKKWILKNKSGERFTLQTHYILIDDRDPIEIFTLDVNLEPMIQAQKQIEQLLESKETLLKEVHHRIKNNMSTISGLLWLQAESLKEPVASVALMDAQSRINNMMVLYNKLYRSENFRVISSKEYLDDLIDHIRDTQDSSSKIFLETNIQDRHLDSKKLLPLGMILNEVLTNVYKYAFPKGRAGRIDVQLSFPDAQTMELDVKDNGVGLPDSIIQTKTDTGFGFVLITMLVEQQGASMDVRNSPGAHFTFRFPI
jgi:PAS domain S-box-containing protein